MALINCPECGRENVSDKAIACPSCGYKLNPQPQNKSNHSKQRNLIIVGAIVILVCILSVTSIFIVRYALKQSAFDENDQIAYDIVMEVCRKAKDPTDVIIISGTVARFDDGHCSGTLKIKASGKVYSILAHNKNGEYELIDAEETLAISPQYEYMYTDINFDKEKVQKAIDDYWD